MRLLLIAVLLTLVIGIAFYFIRSSDPNLQVEPHARQEIEKAKRR